MQHKGTFSSRLLLSNQDKGCTPSVAHSLPLPLGPALLNLSIAFMCMTECTHLSLTTVKYFAGSLIKTKSITAKEGKQGSTWQKFCFGAGKALKFNFEEWHLGYTLLPVSIFFAHL